MVRMLPGKSQLYLFRDYFFFHWMMVNALQKRSAGLT